MMQTRVESTGWRTEDAEFVVVRDGLKPPIGRDVFDALGISVTQIPNSDTGSMIDNITTQYPTNSKSVLTTYFTHW